MLTDQIVPPNPGTATAASAVVDAAVPNGDIRTAQLPYPSMHHAFIAFRVIYFRFTPAHLARNAI